jgi:hypothetical protein
MEKLYLKSKGLYEIKEEEEKENIKDLCKKI